MAKPFDTDAAILRIIADKRRAAMQRKRDELQRERELCEMHNRDARKDERKPLPDSDREMGIFEAQLDRELAMLGHIAKKTCKAFQRDAAQHTAVLDMDTLTTQSVEAATYAITFYFSTVLGYARRTAS